jgi:hypothetical protein
MVNSLRRFDNVVIDVEEYSDNHLKRLHSILQVHGPTITHLCINGVNKNGLKFKQSVLIKWLNTMPNLINIDAGGLYGCQQIQDDTDSQLVHTKITDLGLCPYGLALLLHKTQKACIRRLQLNDSTPLPNINDIFQKHRDTLKDLFLFRPVYTDPKPFLQLKLSKFYCLYSEYMNNRTHDNFLQDVISSQDNLVTLQLGEMDLISNSYPVNPTLLRVICSKKTLTDLCLGFSNEISVDDVYKLQRLTNLTELRVQMNFAQFSVNEEIIESFGNVKLPNLRSLQLEINVQFLTPELLKRLGENFPNLVDYSGKFLLNSTKIVGIFNFIFSQAITIVASQRLS